MTTFAIRTDCRLLIKKQCFRLKRGRSARSQGKTSPYEFLGEQKMWVKVLKHSYGTTAGQHTFTLLVEEILEGYNEYNIGDKFLIKGRNLYPNVIEHIQGEESKRC